MTRGTRVKPEGSNASDWVHKSTINSSLDNLLCMIEESSVRIVLCRFLCLKSGYIYTHSFTFHCYQHQIKPITFLQLKELYVAQNPYCNRSISISWIWHLHPKHTSLSLPGERERKRDWTVIHSHWWLSYSDWGAGGPAVGHQYDLPRLAHRRRTPLHR